MKTTIEVKNRDEGDVIRRALSDPVFRATAMVYGILVELDEPTRQSVLGQVLERLNVRTLATKQCSD